MYHSLLSAQHLERVEEMEGFFRLGPQWRERFSISLSLSVTPLSRSDVVTVPSAAIVEKNETPQYITAPETPVTKATLAPVHVELQKLARRAHIASEKRKRLGEVQTELAQIAELIRVQSERHTTLIGEQQLLTGHLATPELCDAEKLLAEINAMLGLS